MVQSEKSARTHNELLKAAESLFLEHGFDNTGISDIVERAGYSIGAFYRHYKTKSDVLVELWSDFVEEFIEESIRGATEAEDLEAAVDYLIVRCKEYYSHPMFLCYYNASIVRVLDTPKEYTPKGAVAFTEMLYALLLREYPDAPVARLRTYASTIHAVINACSASEILDQNFYFDEQSLREIFLLLTKAAGGNV